MREIRLYGSEGGAAQAVPTPIRACWRASLGEQPGDACTPIDSRVRGIRPSAYFRTSTLLATMRHSFRAPLTSSGFWPASSARCLAIASSTVFSSSLP